MIDDETKKGIEIKGKHNRYMLKKVTKKCSDVVLKKTILEKDLSKDWFSHDFQKEKLLNNDKIIINEIKNKISSYKQQDIQKNRLNNEDFISCEYIVDMLGKDDMKCFYCKNKVYIVYQECRQETQWSVDRINNDIGHNINNVVISCLKCNLQKKSRDSDKFAQTKQLTIKREGID